MFKKEKGVTLVALIITIIVLLILAGVAFNTLLGSNGLLNRAANAANTSEKAKENETTFLNEADNLFQNYITQYNLQ